jgi:hypothetical protein
MRVRKEMHLPGGKQSSASRKETCLFGNLKFALKARLYSHDTVYS